MAELSYPYDSLLQLKDAGLIAASAAAQVGGSNKILTVSSDPSSVNDLGVAAFQGEFVVDATAIETGTGDERFDILLQGSTSSSFASGVVTLACISLGAVPIGGGSAAAGLTRYSAPFHNIFGGTRYPYLRAYTFVAGTIATGVNYSAYLSIRKP